MALGRVFKTILTIKLTLIYVEFHKKCNKLLFTLSPWEALHRLPVFCIRETELRNDPQLILRLPHELEAALHLQHNKSGDTHGLHFCYFHAFLLT